MVEFALVLPILLMLLFGIIDFGLYFYNDLELSHAARDAARRASVATSPAAYSTATAIVQSAHLCSHREHDQHITGDLNIDHRWGDNCDGGRLGNLQVLFTLPAVHTSTRPATAVMRHE